MNSEKGLKWMLVAILVLVLIIGALNIGLFKLTEKFLQAANEPTEAPMAAVLPPVTSTPTEKVEVEEVASIEAEEEIAGEILQNSLSAPALHHSDSHAPEEGYGSFDVGVKSDQIGIAFGWHIRWSKGQLDAGGDGCDLVILTPGWYENLQILDGRYEVYDIPSSDYGGWVEVLGQQRADEQAANYGCLAKTFEELPQWESPIPSSP